VSDIDDDDRHPDDIAAEKEGKALAAAQIDAWFAKNANKLKATIQTYADGEAEEMWWRLREQFWLGIGGKFKEPDREP
jgi:hypothetical protein